MIRVLAICCCVLMIHSLGAQSHSFKVIDSNDGLPSNLVYDVHQTSKGQLWMLTGRGICSFDGTEITTYSNEQIRNIGGEIWTELKVDHEDRIWLRGRNRRVAFLNRRLQLIELNGTDKLQPLNFIYSENREVELLAQSGHYQFDSLLNKLTPRHLFAEPIYKGSVEQLTDQHFPFILIPSRNNVIIYDAQLGKVQTKISIPRVQGALYLDEKTILASTYNYNELLVIDIPTQKITRNIGLEILEKNPNLKTYFRKMMYMDSNRIAISSGYRGLFIYDKKSDEVLNFQHNPFDPASISSDNTYKISKGLASNIFITTRTTGFNMLDLDQRNATHISAFLLENEDAIFEGFVGSIVKGFDQNLWLGTQQGVLRYNPSTNIGARVDLKLPANVEQGVREIYRDSDGNLWVGLSNFGILKLNEKGAVIETFRSQKTGDKKIPNNRIYQILEDKFGVLHVATASGIIQIDKESNVVIKKHDVQFPQLRGKATTSMHYSGDQWMVGTLSEGVFLFRDDQLDQINMTDGLLSNAVTDAMIHSDGAFYIGTFNGLSVIRNINKSDSLEHYFERRILSINEDKDGRVWVTLEDGLYLMQHNGFVKFDADNGFQGGGFRARASYYHEADNTLYFGTNKGVSWFETDRLAEVDSRSNFWIYTTNATDSTFYLNNDNKIKLPYNANTVTVDYGNINVWSQPDLTYEYRMESEVWQPAMSKPLVLQNVPSGKYLFEMRTKTENGQWTLSQNNIHISISYPWWRQPWFYALIGTLFMGVSYWVIKTISRMRKVRREKLHAEIALSNNQQKVSEIEMKALRSQMNPHFMFNSLNSINSFIMKNDTENASDYLTNFAQLMRVILENSRHEWISLESEMRAVRLYIEMEELRFDNKFEYIEMFDETIDLSSIMVPPMLIQPYCENAIWHGLLPISDRSCTLTCRVKKEEDFVIIQIEDNGIGKLASERNKSKFKTTKKSFGMRIIAERLEMVNKNYGLDASVTVTDKSVLDDKMSGTTVSLRLKILPKKVLEPQITN